MRGKDEEKIEAWGYSLQHILFFSKQKVARSGGYVKHKPKVLADSSTF